MYFSDASISYTDKSNKSYIRLTRSPSTSSQAQFRVNLDNTVSDQHSGLTWMRCPVGYNWQENSLACEDSIGEAQVFTWQEALQYASNFAQISHQAWRLPNTKELESLVNRRRHSPALDTAIFSELEVLTQWSATPATDGNSWTINFREGTHLSASMGNSYTIRLVKNSPD